MTLHLPAEVPVECAALLLAGYRSEDPLRRSRWVELASSAAFDWERCARLAEYHGLLPLLARRLSEAPELPCPAEVRQQVDDEARRTTLDNLAALATLRGVLRTLDRAGVPALVVKGPVAALELYGDVGLRPFGDLDLLIPPDSLDCALAAFASLGYRHRFDLPPRTFPQYVARYPEMHLVQDGQGIDVDLHWSLWPPYYSFEGLFDGNWTRAVPVGAATLPGRTLSPGDTLVFLLLHAAKHDWRHLGWSLDVARFLDRHRDLGGDRLQSAFAHHGARRLLAVGLGIVRELFGVPGPETLAALGVDLPAVASLVAAACRQILRDTVPTQRFLWPWRRLFYQALETASDRRRYLYDVVLAPTPIEWQAVPLPDWLAWTYPGIRCVRLATKYGLKLVGR